MESNLIQVKENELVTTSLLVAEKFNKEHNKVLRTIDNLLEGIAKNGYTSKLFNLTYKVNEQNGVEYRMYEMNRDGFTLLAMGFTGSKALEWKLKYIEAFNAMEQKLHSPTFTDNRLEIARLIIQAPESRVSSIRALYPEYFSIAPQVGTLEQIVDANTSYLRWIEDYGISKEWLQDFPTIDIYNNYMRYCTENHVSGMGKKLFYSTLNKDFNLTRKQRADGHRYFISA